MQLSKNFQLHEMEKSSTGIRLGITNKAAENPFVTSTGVPATAR